MQSIIIGTFYFSTTDGNLMGINVVVTWDTGLWRPGTSDRDVQSALQWWKESHTGILDWTLQRTRGLMKILYCTCTSQTLIIITLHLDNSLAVAPIAKVEPFIRETKRRDMMISHRLLWPNVYLKMSIYCCAHICFTLVRGTTAEVWKLNRHWGAAATGGRSEEDQQAQRVTAPLGGETGRISSAAQCGRPQAGGSLGHGRIQRRTARVKDLKLKWRKGFTQEMQQISITHTALTYTIYMNDSGQS